MKVDLSKWNNKLTGNEEELYTCGFDIGGIKYCIELSRFGKGSWSMYIHSGNGWALVRGDGKTPEEARDDLAKSIGEKIALFQSMLKEMEK